MSGVTKILKRADVAVFSFFNCKIHGKKLSAMMRLITELGSTLFAVLVSLALIIQPQKTLKTIGIIMALTLVLSQLIVQSLKRIVNRERPYKALKNSNPLKPTKCVYSFPSGHTSCAFCIALTLSHYIPLLNFIFLAVASLVGISRIYLGCHYPTDVVIGGTISYLSFFLINEFALPILQNMV